jgi:cephalosporin-C deacetylase-like acetyl esterase
MLVGASRDVLEKLQVPLTKSADFEKFWSTTLDTCLPQTTPPVLVDHSTPMKHVAVKDVTVAGFNGDPIKGWLCTTDTAAVEASPTNGCSGSMLAIAYLLWTLADRVADLD